MGPIFLRGWFQLGFFSPMEQQVFENFFLHYFSQYIQFSVFLFITWVKHLEKNIIKQAL